MEYSPEEYYQACGEKDDVPSRTQPYKELRRISLALGIPIETLGFYTQEQAFSDKQRGSEEFSRGIFQNTQHFSVATDQGRPSQMYQSRASGFGRPSAMYPLRCSDATCRVRRSQKKLYFPLYGEDENSYKKDRENEIYSFLSNVLKETINPTPPDGAKAVSKRECNHRNETECCKTCQMVIEAIVNNIWGENEFHIKQKQSQFYSEDDVCNMMPNIQLSSKDTIKKRKRYGVQRTQDATTIYEIPDPDAESDGGFLDFLSSVAKGFNMNYHSAKKELDEIKNENMHYMYQLRAFDEQLRRSQENQNTEGERQCPNVIPENPTLHESVPRTQSILKNTSATTSKETFVTCYSCIPDASHRTNLQQRMPNIQTEMPMPKRPLDSTIDFILCKDCKSKMHKCSKSKKHKHKAKGQHGNTNNCEKLNDEMTDPMVYPIRMNPWKINRKKEPFQVNIKPKRVCSHKINRIRSSDNEIRSRISAKSCNIRLRDESDEFFLEDNNHHRFRADSHDIPSIVFADKKNQKLRDVSQECPSLIFKEKKKNRKPRDDSQTCPSLIFSEKMDPKSRIDSDEFPSLVSADKTRYTSGAIPSLFKNDIGSSKKHRRKLEHYSSKGKYPTDTIQSISNFNYNSSQDLHSQSDSAESTDDPLKEHKAPVLGKFVSEVPELLRGVVGKPRKCGEYKTTSTQTGQNENYTSIEKKLVVISNKVGRIDKKRELEKLLNKLMRSERLQELFKQRLTVYFKGLLTNHDLNIEDNVYGSKTAMNNQIKKDSRHSYDLQIKEIIRENTQPGDYHHVSDVSKLVQDYFKACPKLELYHSKSHHTLMEKSLASMNVLENALDKVLSKYFCEFKKTQAKKESLSDIRKNTENEVRSKIALLSDEFESAFKRNLDMGIHDIETKSQDKESISSGKKSVYKEISCAFPKGDGKTIDPIPKGNTINLLSFHKEAINRHSNISTLYEKQINDRKELEAPIPVPQEDLVNFLDIFQAFARLVLTSNVFGSGTTLFQINIMANKAEKLLQRIFRASMRLNAPAIEFDCNMSEEDNSIWVKNCSQEPIEEQELMKQSEDMFKNRSRDKSPSLEPQVLPQPSPIATPPPPPPPLPPRPLIQPLTQPQLRLRIKKAPSPRPKLFIPPKSPTASFEQNTVPTLADTIKVKNVVKGVLNKLTKEPVKDVRKILERNPNTTNIFSTPIPKSEKARNYLQKIIRAQMEKDKLKEGGVKEELKELQIKKEENGTVIESRVREAQQHFKTMFNERLNIIKEFESKITQSSSDEMKKHYIGIQSSEEKSELKIVFPSKLDETSSYVRVLPTENRDKFLLFNAKPYYKPMGQDIKMNVTKHNYKSIVENEVVEARLKNKKVTKKHKRFSVPIKIAKFLMDTTKAKVKSSEKRMRKKRIENRQRSRKFEKTIEKSNVSVSTIGTGRMTSISWVNTEKTFESEYYSQSSSHKSDSTKAQMFYSCSENNSSKSRSINFFRKITNRKLLFQKKPIIKETIINKSKQHIENELTLSFSDSSIDSREFYLKTPSKTYINPKTQQDKKQDLINRTRMLKIGFAEKFMMSINILSRNYITQREMFCFNDSSIENPFSYLRRAPSDSKFKKSKDVKIYKLSYRRTLRDMFYKKMCAKQNVATGPPYFFKQNKEKCVQMLFLDDICQAPNSLVSAVQKQKKNRLKFSELNPKDDDRQAFVEAMNCAKNEELILPRMLSKTSECQSLNSSKSDKSTNPNSKPISSENINQDDKIAKIEIELQQKLQSAENQLSNIQRTVNKDGSTIAELIENHNKQNLSKRIAILKEILNKLNLTVFLYRKMCLSLQLASHKISRRVSSTNL